MTTALQPDQLREKIRRAEDKVKSVEESLDRAMKAEPQDTVLITRILDHLRIVEGEQAELEVLLLDLDEWS